jgi:hypothetical protein
MRATPPVVADLAGRTIERGGSLGRMRLMRAAMTVLLALTIPAGADAGSHLIGDGTYIVGVTIEAGAYATTGDEGCAWARLAMVGGGPEDVIAKGNPRGPGSVSIEPTDAAFETYGCGGWWLIGAAPPLAAPDGASPEDRAAYVEVPAAVLAALEPLGSGFPNEPAATASQARAMADDVQEVLLRVGARPCYANLYVAAWRLVSDLRHMADHLLAGDEDALVFIELLVPDLRAINEAHELDGC